MTTMQLTQLSTPTQRAAGARSALYGCLARALAFPTPQLVEEVASGRLRGEIEVRASLLPFPFTPTEDGKSALADPSLTYEEVEREYIRLFEVGAGRPPCPLYEGYHRSGRMKLMEETVRFYEHFGLRAHPGDQPDHLCAQLEFMHYLAFKEAAALVSGGPTVGLVSAQRDFLSRHLCRWLPLVRARAEDCGALPFYRALLLLAERFCAADLGACNERGAKPDRKSGSCLTDEEIGVDR